MIEIDKHLKPPQPWRWDSVAWPLRLFLELSNMQVTLEGNPDQIRLSGPGSLSPTCTHLHPPAPTTGHCGTRFVFAVPLSHRPFQSVGVGATVAVCVPPWTLNGDISPFIPLFRPCNCIVRGYPVHEASPMQFALRNHIPLSAFPSYDSSFAKVRYTCLANYILLTAAVPPTFLEARPPSETLPQSCRDIVFVANGTW